MLSIRTILHPTDFSERSEYAFHAACALARDYGARLLVLHVGAAPLVGYGVGVVPPEPERYQEELREKLRKLRVEDPRVQVEHRLIMGGDAAGEILRVAAEAKGDLIVMGTHGWTGLGRVLMGSVAEQVVRKAACPVLTVRAPFSPAEEKPGVEGAGKTLEVAR